MAQEECRTGNARRRWLLPFSTGVDFPTIEQALRLAEAARATLVTASFLPMPERQGVRLELIQQSNDFLEAIRYKARRLSISIECHELWARDIPASILAQLHALGCESLVLAIRGDRALLLHPQELRQLLFRPPAALVLLRFPPQATPVQTGFMARLRSRVQQLGSSRLAPSGTVPPNDSPALEKGAVLNHTLVPRR